MAVAFDVAASYTWPSGSATGTSTTWSWSHTAKQNALVLPVVCWYSSNTTLPSSFAFTPPAGFSQLQSWNISGSFGAVVCGLFAGLGTGAAQTLAFSASWTNSLSYYHGASSVSYTGVGAIGQQPGASGNGSSSAMSIAVPSAKGHTPVAFHCYVYGAIAPSSVTGNNRVSNNDTSWTYGGITIADTAGNGPTTTLSASEGSTYPWISMGIDLIPGGGFVRSQAVQRALL